MQAGKYITFDEFKITLIHFSSLADATTPNPNYQQTQFTMGAFVGEWYRNSIYHCMFLANKYLRHGATWLETERLGKLIACNSFQATTSFPVRDPFH